MGNEIKNINLLNLQEGLIIKNYKQLCKLLNEKITDGNSKKAQEKEWKRYFNYEKNGQRYIIIKIYEKPLEKDDNRISGNNSIYIENIEVLLLYHLLRQKGYEIQITLKNLFLLLGMINNKYLKLDNKEIKETINYIDDFQINHFYQRSYQKLRETIFSSLKNLRNRRLISYEIITMINITEENNYSIQTITREATNYEKTIIDDIEREVLKNMELYSINLVHLKFKTREFYGKVNKLLLERYNINYCYEDIRILFTQKNIIEGLKESEINIKKQMLELNSKIIDSINKQAENNIEKNKKEIERKIEELKKDIFGEPDQIIINNMFKLDREVYLYCQKKMVELLIEL